MNKAPKIIVAIPCYNCEKQIPRVIKGFSKSLLSNLEEVIIINNRSSDDTVGQAIQAIKKTKSKKFSVYTNNKNYNLGGSHKVAFLYAEKKSADCLIILHGDDQAKTIQILDLIKSYNENQDVDAILGSRFSKQSRLYGYSKERILGNKILNILYTILTFHYTKDLGSGLNMFKLSSLKDHKYLGFGDNLAFNFDMLLDYYRKKSKIIYVPITWRETDQVSNAHNLTVAKMAIYKLIRWRVGKEKLISKLPSAYSSNKVWPK